VHVYKSISIKNLSAFIPIKSQGISSGMRDKFCNGYTFINSIQIADKVQDDLERSKISQSVEEFVIMPSLNFIQKYKNELENWTTAPVHLKFVSNQIGFGVFASEKILNGSLLGIYAGVLKRRSDLENTLYSFAYMPKQFNIVDLVVDAHQSGNVTRFINDSINNNANVQHIYFEGKWYLVFLASMDINKNQQVLINYGKSYFKTNKINRIELYP